MLWDLSRLGAKSGLAAHLGPQELLGRWEDLACDNAARAYRAARALTTTARTSVPFLANHLKPVADERHVRLTADLDAGSFRVRQAASEELGRLGSRAEPALRAALENRPSLEVRQRIEALLARIARQQLRAVQVLEQIGSEDSRRLLKELALGAGSVRLTREARTAMERLNNRQAPAARRMVFP